MRYESKFMVMRIITSNDEVFSSMPIPGRGEYFGITGTKYGANPTHMLYIFQRGVWEEDDVDDE